MDGRIIKRIRITESRRIIESRRTNYRIIVGRIIMDWRIIENKSIKGRRR